jgi:hypothetical protein
VRRSEPDTNATLGRGRCGCYRTSPWFRPRRTTRRRRWWVVEARSEHRAHRTAPARPGVAKVRFWPISTVLTPVSPTRCSAITPPCTLVFNRCSPPKKLVSLDAGSQSRIGCGIVHRSDEMTELLFICAHERAPSADWNPAGRNYPTPDRSWHAASSAITQQSAGQRRRISRDEFHEIGLPHSAGLFEQTAEMRLDRCVRDSKRGSNFRNTAYFDDGKQHAKLSRR